MRTRQFKQFHLTWSFMELLRDFYKVRLATQSCVYTVLAIVINNFKTLLC